MGILPGIQVPSSPRRRLGDGGSDSIFAFAAVMSPQLNRLKPIKTDEPRNLASAFEPKKYKKDPKS